MMYQEEDNVVLFLYVVMVTRVKIVLVGERKFVKYFIQINVQKIIFITFNDIIFLSN